MKTSTDPEFARFKNAGFAKAKPVAKTPHLRKLQAQAGGKSRVTVRVDSDALPKDSVIDPAAARPPR